VRIGSKKFCPSQCKRVENIKGSQFKFVSLFRPRQRRDQELAVLFSFPTLYVETKSSRIGAPSGVPKSKRSLRQVSILSKDEIALRLLGMKTRPARMSLHERTEVMKVKKRRVFVSEARQAYLGLGFTRDGFPRHMGSKIVVRPLREQMSAPWFG